MPTSRSLLLAAAVFLSGCASAGSGLSGDPVQPEIPSSLSELPAPIALPTEWGNTPLTETLTVALPPTSAVIAPTQTPTIVPTASPEPTATPVPGLFIEGAVRIASGNAAGLPGASIYLRIANGPTAQRIATTDDQGRYRSDFIELRNQETLTLWAELPGYTMQPSQHAWSQYAYGVQTKTLDFEASPATPPPPTVTPAGQPGPP